MDAPDSPALEMRHLRLVAAIVEHGSLTAAARVLHLTQPALSHQLRELETRLRAPLFVRTSRRMVATPTGDELARVARAVLSEVGAFERRTLAGELSEARGTIRIATECYTCYHWLPGVLRAFRERWPAIDLRIAPEHTASPAAALRDGALDLAILMHPVADRRLRLDPLFQDELVVIVAPGHRLARRPWVSPEELAQEHLILYTTSGGRSAILADVLEPAGVAPERVTRIQLTEAIIELVAAGLGVGVLARWAVAPMVRAGTLQSVRLTEQGFSRTWFVATRADDPSPAYRFELVDLLRRHLADGPTVQGTRIA